MGIQLSKRFLAFLQRQLQSFESESAIKSLVIYIAQSKDGKSPSLEPVGSWPEKSNSLLPVEADQQLRSPSPERRWYPLQNESILLGVLRAEIIQSEDAWHESLDRRLQATADSLTQFLALDLEQLTLLDELTNQREKLSIMVHQLKNPLTALRTYATLLLRKMDPENKQRNLVESMLIEQQQLDKYISALDKLSEPKLSIKQLSSSPLLLPPVLPEADKPNLRSLLQPLIDRSEAKANLQQRDWNPPAIWPDWTLQKNLSSYGVIAEIVANLLENAFLYSNKCSPIGLHLTDRAICVWDFGDEIHYDERENIFKKGFRGKFNKQKPGTGIGLALGRQLAKEIGADLKLFIPPRKFCPGLPEKGNAFVLILPKEL